MFRQFTLALILVALYADRGSAAGMTIEIFPGTNVFSAAAQSLRAGDTLVVHQGTYKETALILRSINWVGKRKR